MSIVPDTCEMCRADLITKFQTMEELDNTEARHVHRFGTSNSA